MRQGDARGTQGQTAAGGGTETATMRQGAAIRQRVSGVWRGGLERASGGEGGTSLCRRHYHGQMGDHSRFDVGWRVTMAAGITSPSQPVSQSVRQSPR